MKKIKILLSAVLCLTMLLSALPMSVFADTTKGGTCGENVTWSLDTETGVLTISGSGDMYNYNFNSYAEIPWYLQKSCIESVNIENGVTSIGDWAFFDCSLTSVTIPNSVLNIGGCAFRGCSSLTSITIPNSVTSIGGGAFSGTAFYNNEDNWENCVLYCGNYLIEANDEINGNYIINEGTKVIADSAFEYCTSLTSVMLPNSVTSIGDWAFFDCSLTSVTIGNGVTSIGERAFADCSSLTSVTIPDSVTSIGYGAFSGCYSLTSVTIPNSVTSIGEYAFSGCIWLTSVTILNSVTIIGDCAFRGCSSLTSVTIPNSVTSIGDDAFRGCSSLTSVIIPNSVTSIGERAFYGCDNLTIYGYSGSAAETSALENAIEFISIGYAVISGTCGEDLTWSLDTETGVLTISGSGDMYEYDEYNEKPQWYSQRSYIKSVNIENGVTSIGYGAFYDTAFYNNEDNWENSVLYCGNYLIDAKNKISGPYTIKKGTEVIADGAFYSCSSLTSVTIPDSVTSMGDAAFYSCSSLNSVTIPNSVTSIGDEAFRYCSSLTSVTVPDSVTRIGYDAFYGTAFYNNEENWENGVLYCGNYLIEAKYEISGSYTIKEGTKVIADDAFYGCSSLTSVTIPESVTSIGWSAFSGCSRLVSINVYSDNQNFTSQDGVLFDKNKIRLICCPSGKSGEYVIPNSVTEIGYYAFSGFSSLTAVTIPDSVTSIGDGAFYGCSSLKDVYYTGTHAQRNAISVNTGNSYLTTATWHYVQCEQNGHTYDNACDIKCNICGANRIITHTYSNTCDTDCNICGNVRTITHTYDNACDKDCNVCGATRTITHIYSNACDADCNICGNVREITHTYDNACDKECNVCGFIRTVPDHVYDNACDTDCNICGATRTVTHTYSNACDTTCNICGNVREITHEYRTIVRQATLSKNGSIVKKCSVCGTTASTTVIYSPKTFKLSTTSYTYSGSSKKPSVSVKDYSGKTLKNGTDYTVSYKNNKNVGTATATVTFKGNYQGSKKLTFTIKPKTTSLSKLTAGKKQLKVTWKKNSAVSGYQIQYSTSKKFSSAKTVTVKGYKTTSKTIKSLKSKKTYYVRVRTYKTVSGKKVYSDWSAKALKKATK